MAKLGAVALFAVLAVGATESGPAPDWPLLLKLGLEEAVTRGKLPDLNRLAKGDKIQVFLGCKQGGRYRITLDVSSLPKQVAKWQLISIDEKFIARHSAKQPFGFMRVCSFIEGGQPGMRFVADSVVPPGSHLIVIDRGILDIRFEWREGKWTIDTSEPLYAHMDFRGTLSNSWLEPSACGTLTARHDPPALARRGSTMRYKDIVLWETQSESSYWGSSLSGQFPRPQESQLGKNRTRVSRTKLVLRTLGADGSQDGLGR